MVGNLALILQLSFLVPEILPLGYILFFHLELKCLGIGVLCAVGTPALRNITTVTSCLIGQNGA